MLFKKVFFERTFFIDKSQREKKYPTANEKNL